MKNKVMFIALLMCFCVLLVAETNNIWMEDFELAIKHAQSYQKPIFILFTGSDWCRYCIVLESEVFSQAEFIEFARENLVLLKIDRPQNIEQTEELRAQNAMLFQKYEIVGVPTIVIIDHEENVLATTGYYAGGASVYVDHIKELLP